MAIVQSKLASNPYGGHVFVLRRRRGDSIKLLWWDRDGLCLLCKRLERGHFVWPQASDGSVYLSAAQLSMPLEGMEWRRPRRSADTPGPPADRLVPPWRVSTPRRRLQPARRPPRGAGTSASC
ncbi:IS66 family insertion sequence element accessory protein TnpB [Pandoraea oxalativorans]